VVTHAGKTVAKSIITTHDRVSATRPMINHRSTITTDGLRGLGSAVGVWNWAQVETRDVGEVVGEGTRRVHSRDRAGRLGSSWPERSLRTT
jgi:hypothetical protein